jgi:hypothetical protein
MYGVLRRADDRQRSTPAVTVTVTVTVAVTVDELGYISVDYGVSTVVIFSGKRGPAHGDCELSMRKGQSERDEIL